MRRVLNSPPPLPLQHSTTYSCYSWAWLRATRVRRAFCCERLFWASFCLKLKLMCRKSQVQHAMPEPQYDDNGFCVPWALASWYMSGNFCQPFVCRWLARAISLDPTWGCQYPNQPAFLLEFKSAHNNCQFMVRASFQLICHTTNCDYLENRWEWSRKNKQ